MPDECPFCGNELKKVEGIIVDPLTGFVVLDGRLIKFTITEAKILDGLVSRMPRPVSKETIMDDVYGLFPEREEPIIKNLSVYVCKVRKKLVDTSWMIETVWGYGFRILRRKDNGSP